VTTCEKGEKPMGSVSHRDVRDVLDVTRKFFDYKEVDELRKNVLGLLDPLFCTDRGNFFLTSDLEERLDLKSIVNTGIEGKYIDQFRQHYHKWDPFVRSLSCCQSDVYTTEQLLPYEDLRKTKYYNEFLKPQKIHSQIVIYLRSAKHLLGVVALFRPPAQEVFSETDRIKAEMMVPYLTAALEKTIVSDQVAQKELIINSIASGVPSKGIVVLNENLEKVYINETARDILSAMTENHEKKGQEARLPELLQRRCEECVRSTPDGMTGDRKGEYSLSVEVAGRNVLLHMRLVHSPPKNPFLILFLEPDERSVPFAKRLVEAGLTRRELEVVSLVCQGLSNAAISEKLFISEYTVWNHLRSIFEKVGVRNRTSLAHLIATL
jgi:DNA-binding CsgD family transcriptional regulator